MYVFFSFRLQDYSKYWHGNKRMTNALFTFMDLYEKIRIGELQDKDQMIREFHKIANLFYQRPYVSRGLFQVVIEAIRRIYCFTGNVSALNLQFPLHDKHRSYC